MNRLAPFAELLSGLQERGAYRQLRGASGADFTSNDYLALKDSDRLRATLARALEAGVPIGAGGSRLLRGNHPEHEGLEEAAARFFGAERALLFGSGYAANTALLSTLPQRDDLVVYDEFVHASVHDGMKLGRARTAAFTHNDVTAAEDTIRTWRVSGGRGSVWIVVESLYSMEGDCAPLAEFKALSERTEAFLMIDEAHATGVFGEDGRGLATVFEGSDNAIILHTGGKALGVSGALVTGPAILCDFLVNRARPFIFATAPSPLVAIALAESLAILREEPERRARLTALIGHARRALTAQFCAPTQQSQILPIIVGESEPTLRAAEKLQAAGFDVRAIRPPTVPQGTARLRISITLNADESAIDGLVDALQSTLPASRSPIGSDL